MSLHHKSFKFFFHILINVKIQMQTLFVKYNPLMQAF